MKNNRPPGAVTPPVQLRWIRYLSEVDGKQALITVDQCLRDECQDTHPYMGWIRLCTELENATDSLEETMLHFNRFAPELFETLHRFPSRLAGYIVEQNEITLVFYSRERIRLIPVLREFLKSRRQWTIRPGQLLDECWETYTELLYPNNTERKDLRYFTEPV